ncbi:type VII secretion target [Kitasatospora viridis]|uniref:Excreted virulence factor EspC (Type VII ESX diderm) n=1 Tax=Kitasatospora viridis TaxID=281105 RepID=A0A561UKD5_9ACTN|nr:type VII secretion target [Kitasatospora viridis]TWF99823.1 excreted virulence factor EspC (type VII ESX diderm) [Kitasatospora viridis]
MSTDFTVHPDALQAAGQNAQTVAGKIPDEAKTVGTPTDTAVAGLKGWQSAPALQGCTSAWRGLLASLSDTMGQQGRNLVATAQNYRNGDVAAANQFPTGPSPYQGKAVPDPFGTAVKGQGVA